MRWYQKAFYSAANSLMWFLLLLLSDCKVIGRENVPKDGPLVLVANHQNLIDPPLLGACLARPVIFMAKRELFEAPVFGWLVFLYGAILVRRGEADRNALRLAKKVVAEGGVLGMFPEGHRSPTAELLPGRGGAAHIAFTIRSPLLPVGIVGTNKVTGVLSVLRRPRIRVMIGTPFLLPDKGGRSGGRDLDAMTDELMLRIAALLPETHHGVYRARTAVLGKGTDR